MLKSINDSNLPVRSPDENTKITQVFSDADAEMSFVKIECSGDHGISSNRSGDRIYYVLEGSGEVYFDNDWHSVKPGDCAYIRKGRSCSIRGKLKGLIINSPPFNPKSD
ncbi:MAG: cupin domain-containing protein [Lactobacillaceae bacterium]|jgi:mannose-6-phosphate isomerase-like protein (cupin superfamily)|nr:cupin domain-containing protein [Lactobacillaceae bacterium]